MSEIKIAVEIDPLVAEQVRELIQAELKKPCESGLNCVICAWNRLALESFETALKYPTTLKNDGKARK